MTSISDWGGLAIIVLAFLAGGWHFARWTGKVDQRFLNIDEKLLNIDEKLSKIDSKVDRLVSMMFDAVSHGKAPPSGDFTKTSPFEAFFAQKSPVTLTKKSVGLAKRLNVEDTIKPLINKIDIPQDASPFIIQQASEVFVFTRLMEVVSSDVRAKIEHEAYEYGGNIGDVLFVYSILLRNKILEARGFSVPEDDKSKSMTNVIAFDQVLNHTQRPSQKKNSQKPKRS